jgi:hypothetical protein
MKPTEQEAAAAGWERTSELKWLESSVPGERATLMQKWTKVVHGWEDEQWLPVPTTES